MDISSPVEKVLVPRQSVSSSVEDEANSPSLSQLVSTLVPTLVVAAIYVGFFILFRTRIARAYSPRTFLGSLPSQERTPELPKGFLNWIGRFSKLPDSYVLNHQSLDGYLLLRFLKISVAICFVGCLVTWPVLFPVNATGGGGQEQLNLLTMSNIGDNDKNRYYAHALMAWVFFGFVFYMVMRENIFYIHLRQAYLLSPLYANRMSSRTVLFMNVPPEYRDEDLLRKMLGEQVKNLWIATDCSKLQKMTKKRDKLAMKLEAAETKLVKRANRARLKEEKKGNHTISIDNESESAEPESTAAHWISAKKRPTHRLRFLFGKKVDTISWCRQKLRDLVPQVDALQDQMRIGEGEYIGAVFAEYYTQLDAQEAFQSLAHHQALHMEPRFIGLNPDDIIWENLNISWASRVLRTIATSALVGVTVIFWAFPTAFVGALSNIDALSKGDPTATPPLPPLLPFLSFVNDLPEVILGVIQGLLPSVLLSLLMALLPIFLYWMARIDGKPSRPTVELRVQNTYFVFQVIQVFLITTISSGASAAVIQIIREPAEATSLLAENLPKASNFYISYFILQGLATAALSLAQILTILLFTVLGKLLDSTPRKMYKRFVDLPGIGWGTEFPVYTLLTVIAITYSMIAPLVLGFATIGMFLIYLAYRYNLLFVFNADIDTKGLVYPRALQHTTVGCYLGIVCLIGLFAIQHTPGPLILMIVLLVVCVIFHWVMNTAIDPLLRYLPRSLQVEEQSLLAIEQGDGNLDEKAMPIVTTESNGQNSKLNPELKKANFIKKFFFPHKYADYYTLRKLVPHDFADLEYDANVERNAFHHPAIKSPTPMLWIPKDPMGVSAQECRDTCAIGVPMSNEMAGFNEKGKMIWDHENARPPIYEEKVYY